MDTLQWIISIGTNIREATQLNDELSRLQTTLPKARFLINHSEWGRFKNKELAMLLSQLKDTTYDAEDLLREFNDQVMLQKIEDADRSWPGQLFSSSLNFAKTLICGSKTRIKQAQDKVDKVVAEIEGVLNMMALNIETVQHMPETSSVIGVAEVFGRDKERDLVIEKLGMMIGRDDKRDQVIKLLGVPVTRGGTSAQTKGKRAALGAGATSASIAKKLKGESCRARSRLAEAKCTSNVSVLPIVGIGGVGKTTLAQFIYNDPRVKAHFSVRIWVCVSDLFDKRRITKEIIESIYGEEYKSSCSLNALQVELTEQLKSQKFLLVLDDIWPNASDEWEAFYAPLRHGLEGSMILVTTRSPNVADLVTTNDYNPVQLEGLDKDIFFEFFRKCAFGKECPESYPQLHDISQNIASRLCGSPLAAKTLGRLLNMELTVQHWETVQNSELWELPHRENEILPALQLSYLYLPQELKRCFAFCSIFPKDYSFERDEIVDIWVAEGFVASGGGMRLEDMGNKYLDDLKSRFLFQSDPRCPDQTRYVMHDLIHDMAQFISVDECFLMQDLSFQNQRRMPPHAVRHMSVNVDGESLSRMKDVQYLNKLHSLRFGTRLKVEITWFNHLSNILFLCLQGCDLVNLPESICELNSLRYLDISHSRLLELPEKLWCLYRLQVVDASHSSLQIISPGVTKLINLRRLGLPSRCSLKFAGLPGLGNLSCLRNLRHFTVGTSNKRRIGELKGMNQLSGTLSIRSICNVGSKEEAAEARLVDKQYLKALILLWRENGICDAKNSENGVVEGLRPPPRIEYLKVQKFGGDSFSPSWFNPERLLTLRSLELCNCRFLRSLSIPSLPSLEELMLTWVDIEALAIFAGPTGADSTLHGGSSSSNGISGLRGLTRICLVYCEKLRNLDQCLSPEYLPSVKSIEIRCCRSLESIPAHSFVGFDHLQDLKIRWCKSLVCEQAMVLPLSLRRLYISNCGGLDKSFPACLQNLTSLIALSLDYCHNMESILIGTNLHVKYLFLYGCSELSSVGGLHALSSMQYVNISHCPKLHEVEQPFLMDLLTKEENEKHHKFFEFI